MNTTHHRPNEAERQRWNDDYWTSSWPRRVALTSSATPVLLDAVDLKAGEVVLDVGSGTGETTLEAAARVGVAGRAVGADISEALVDYARRAAAKRAAANTWFVVADAQHETVPGKPFDAAISQFGVMFFEDPVAAFSNLRAHVADRGRLGFACWRTPAENPWFVGHALAGFLVPPPAPLPGRHATGPFAFSDPDDVASILAAAGWGGVERQAVDRTVVLERTALTDDGQAAHLGVATEALADAARAVDEYYAPFTLGDGRVEVPIAYQVFTAANRP